MCRLLGELVTLVVSPIEQRLVESRLAPKIIIKGRLRDPGVRHDLLDRRARIAVFGKMFERDLQDAPSRRIVAPFDQSTER